MSLSCALEAAINRSTGPRATLSHGLQRTKPHRRRSGPRPTPGILTPQARRRPPDEEEQSGLARTSLPPRASSPVSTGASYRTTV
jgi:hypothetical protein